MKALTSSLAMIAAFGAALAATPAAAQHNDAALHAGALEIGKNKSQVVTSDRPIGRALIGSAAVADVLPISERSVYTKSH